MNLRIYLAVTIAVLTAITTSTVSFARTQSSLTVSNQLGVGSVFEITQDIIFEPRDTKIYFAGDEGFSEGSNPAALAQFRNQVCEVRVKDNGDTDRKRRIKKGVRLTLSKPPIGIILQVKSGPFATTSTQYIINSQGVDSITCYIVSSGSNMPTLDNVRSALSNVMTIIESDFLNIE